MSTHDRQSQVLTLGNEYLTFGFDGASGTLVSLVDRASGYEFIRDAAAPKTLFRLALRHEDKELEWLDSREAGKITAELHQGAQGTTLTLCAGEFSGRKMAVTVEVSLQEGSPLSVWRMFVTGVEAGQAVQALLCPILSGVLQVGGGIAGEAIATPVQSEGYLFTDPYPVVDNLPLRAGYPESPHVGMGEIHGTYPGGLSMQLLLYYNRHAGLYLACHDAGMHVKGFHLGQMADWGLYPTMWLAHHPPETGDAAFEYDTIVGVFHGDWYAGADMYKAWARRQWWCEKKLAERDIAGWLREGFGVWQMSNYHLPEIKLNHSIDQIAEDVNGLSREIGVPLAALVFNYERGGGWTGPVGLPPKEGEEAFNAGMAKLCAAGNHGFVYIPGGNWYVAIDSYNPPFDSRQEYEARGRAITIMNEKSELPIASWYQGWHSARLCPATEGNREVLSDELLSCMEWGCDWVQIDNFPCGSPEACYSPDHGHPPGYGPWYTQAWRETLAEVRRRAKAMNPDCVLSTEGITEVYIPYLDLYDNRAGNMEYFGHYNPQQPMDGQTIPIFEYIYSGYIGAYQAAYPECNRPEVLYWTRCLGKSLTQGVVPSAGRYWPEPAQSNPVTLAFYRKIIRATRDAWQYITFGEMLPPPVIDIPDIQASYLQFTGECLEHLLEKNRHVVTERAVQHSAWRAEDGAIGYLFANISQLPVEFSMTLSSYTAEPGTYRVKIVVDSERMVVNEQMTLPCEHTIRMEPLSVTMIEVTSVSRG